MAARHLSVFIRVFLSVWLPVYLTAWLLVTCLSICLSAYLSVCLSTCLSVWVTACLHVPLSACLSVHLSVRLSAPHPRPLSVAICYTVPLNFQLVLLSRVTRRLYCAPLYKRLGISPLCTLSSHYFPEGGGRGRGVAGLCFNCATLFLSSFSGSE